MTPKQLEQLVDTLIYDGYSRRYVQRLVGEIEDHRLCIHESTPATNGRRQAEEDSNRIGTHEEIIAAVYERRELKSIFNRHSFVTFGLIPSTVLLVTTALVIWASNRFVEDFNPDSVSNIQLVLKSIAVTQYVFPVLIAGLVGVIAKRCRVAFFFPAMTTMLIGCCAVFQVDFGYCELSNSLVCYQHWELDAVQLASVWLGLGFGLAIWNKTPKLKFANSRHHLV